jgi:hypothetical protein
MKLNRRQFLKGAPAAGALLILPVGAALPEFVDHQVPPQQPFTDVPIVGFTRVAPIPVQEQFVLDFRENSRLEATLTMDRSPVVMIMPPEANNLQALIKQDDLGGHAITEWPKEVQWLGGEAPTFHKDPPSTIRMMTFHFDGKNYYAESSVYG